MHNLILLAPVLLGLVTAAPFKDHSVKSIGSFTVNNVAKGSRRAKDPLAAITRSFTKFGMDVPAELSTSTTSTTNVLLSSALSNSSAPSTNSLASTSGGESGSVAATSQGNGDVEFLSPVTIGGQTMMMNFDTGSSDLWVFSTELPASLSTGHKNLYDRSKSSTFKQMPGYSFSVAYGDGSFTSGSIVGTETVNIGGASVTNQAIELASTVAPQFVKDTASNGLVGLGFSDANTVSPVKQTTFLDTIKNDLALPIFTASLKHGSNGSYDFGKIDSSLYQGNIVSVPAIENAGHWGFQSTGFAVGANPSFQYNNSASLAIADTGTSLLLLDPEVVTAYYAQVPGSSYSATAKGYTFPCSTTFPDFHFTVSSGFYNTIPGSYLTYVQVSNTVCYGAMQSNAGGGLQIYGDVLFKAQFVVFNIGNKTLGFADHA